MKTHLSSADGRKEPLEPDAKNTTKAVGTLAPPAEPADEPRDTGNLGDLDSLPAVPSKGQPLKLTAKVSKIICDAIRAGNYPSVACRAAHISLDSLARWRKRGAAGEEPFAQFLRDLQQAEDDHEVAAVKAVHRAGKQDWRAHLEILSRRHPERWSRERERAAFGFSGDDIGRGAGLNIILHLGIHDLPLPGRIAGPLDPRVQRELQDHRARERDIEDVEILKTPPKDAV